MKKIVAIAVAMLSLSACVTTNSASDAPVQYKKRMVPKKTVKAHGDDTKVSTMMSKSITMD